MLITLGILVAAIAAGVGVYIFVRNNPNKVKKIEDIKNVIKK